MRASLRRAWSSVQDAVRSRLWPIPVLAIVLALVAGVTLPLLDAAVDGQFPTWFSTWIFGGGAGAARTVLDAVASSLITVTSLTFSLTVVTLQLASSQFSPRLLRTFTSDLFVQATLALFLATFTYALTVLRVVRSPDESQSVFVPRISVTLAFLLAVASVVMLVSFLAHLTRLIRVETMVLTVHAEASATISTQLDDRPDREHVAPLPHPPSQARRLWTPRSGFLLHVDESELFEAADDADAIIVIEALPGAYVVEGTPIGWVWQHDADLSDDSADRLQHTLDKSIRLGPERTGGQDVAYGLRQLTDVINKALSSGINDPTTAVHGLGHLSAVLCELAQHQLGPTSWQEEGSVVRLALNRPGLDYLLDASLSQPRAYGASDVQLMARLYRLLNDLAWLVRDADRDAVALELARLNATADEQDFDPPNRATLAGLAQDVEQVLTRDALVPASATGSSRSDTTPVS